MIWEDNLASKFALAMQKLVSLTFIASSKAADDAFLQQAQLHQQKDHRPIFPSLTLLRVPLTFVVMDALFCNKLIAIVSIVIFTFQNIIPPRKCLQKSDKCKIVHLFWNTLITSNVKA